MAGHDRRTAATGAASAWGRANVAACGALVILAFLVRAAGTAAFEGLGAPPNEGAFYDGVEFEQIARQLVEERRFARADGIPTSFRAPGFPFLLAGVYALAGPGNYLAAHLAFCLVGALIVVPTYALGRQLLGRSVAIVSGALVAVMPGVAYYSIHFSSEPLHALALVTATALLAAAVARGHAGLVLAAGLALGAAALVRPVAAYFLPLFALVLWFVYPARRVRATLALAAGTLVMVLPWTVRNHRVHDRWLLLASNGGSTFWGSNNDVVAGDPQLRGEWISTRGLRGTAPSIARLPNEVDRDRAEFERGKDWVRAHPGSAAQLAWWKTVKLWTPFPSTDNRMFQLVTAAGFLAWAPFALAGVLLLIRVGGAATTVLLVLAAPVAGTQIAAMLFYGSARFRSPVEPLLMVCAAVALVAAGRRVLHLTFGQPSDVDARRPDARLPLAPLPEAIGDAAPSARTMEGP